MLGIRTRLRRYKHLLKLCAVGILKLDPIRFYFCYWRWRWNKHNMKVHEGHGTEVAETAISYNLTAFENDAAFGMAKRMALIVYPIAAIFRNKTDARILIIGPRTEDDIFWARSMGLYETRGFDLFSYSDLIDVGDMHKTDLPPQSYDAILFGWVLTYSTRPEVAIAEMKRVLKPGGFLAVGMESLASEHFERTKSKRNNQLNRLSELKTLVNEEVIFDYDPGVDEDRCVAAIFRMK